eukprot:7270051-Prymnesium_polylepis.1
MFVGHFVVCWCQIHDLFEFKRSPFAPGIRHTRIFMTWLQVQPHSLRLSDFGRKRLRFVRPGLCVEVDEHVVARAQIAPRLNFGNLEQSWPDAIELLGNLSRPRVMRAAVHADGK